MDQVLHGVTSVYVYIDDVLIASSTPEQHLKDLRTVFERLTAHSIVVNPNKCVFGVSSLEFPGHLNDSKGISPLPDKIKAIREFPQPQSPSQFRRFIGLVNFYHRFLLHCAELMQSLHSLHSGEDKSQTLVWTDTAVAAFNATKEAVCVEMVWDKDNSASRVEMVHRGACRLSKVGVTRAGAGKVRVRVKPQLWRFAGPPNPAASGPVVVHVDHTDHVEVTNLAVMSRPAN